MRYNSLDRSELSAPVCLSLSLSLHLSIFIHVPFVPPSFYLSVLMFWHVLNKVGVHYKVQEYTSYQIFKTFRSWTFVYSLTLHWMHQSNRLNCFLLFKILFFYTSTERDEIFDPLIILCHLIQLCRSRCNF